MQYAGPGILFDQGAINELRIKLQLFELEARLRVIEEGGVGSVVSGTSATTRVATSTSAVTLLAANANRVGCTVWNESSEQMYLLLGTGTPSATAYTIIVAANGYYEVPFGWTGAVQAVLASGTGQAEMTEFTA